MNKMRTITALLSTALVVLSGLAFGQTVSQTTRPSQAELLAVLRSEASQHQKMEACRQLAVAGGRESVPVLAALLADEKLAHMARYALEQIPEPAVEEALRHAVPKLRGRLLAGALMSLGARLSANATRVDKSDAKMLAGYLRDSDIEVASAAACALGRIGTPTTAKTIKEALPGAPDAVKPALWDAALRCAGSLAAQGPPQPAIGLYDMLRRSGAPVYVRVGATRGAVLTRQKDGIPLLVELLRDNDRAMFNVALELVNEFPGAEATRAVTAHLAVLPAGRKALVVQALGNRGDKSALPAIRAAAKQREPDVRIAAIKAIAQLGDLASLPILFEAATVKNESIVSAAVAAVVRLPGKSVDDALMRLVAGPDNSRSLMAIDCLARRLTYSAKPSLLKAASEGRPAVRLAALKALAEIATDEDLAPIVGLLLKADSAPERDAAERTLIRISSTAKDSAACVDRLVEPLDAAQPQQKMALLRVLEAIGGPKALQAARNAAKDANADVGEAAVRALCNWSTSDAAPDLIDLARHSANPANRVLALRGYIRLAGDESLTMDRRLAMCAEALPLIQRDEEKRQWLGVLSAVPSPRAPDMISPLIGDAAVCEEACSAAVAVAGKLLHGPDASKPEFKQCLADIAESLQKAAKATKNSRLSVEITALQARVEELKGRTLN